MGVYPNDTAIILGWAATGYRCVCVRVRMRVCVRVCTRVCVRACV